MIDWVIRALLLTLLVTIILMAALGVMAVLAVVYHMFVPECDTVVCW